MESDRRLPVQVGRLTWLCPVPDAAQFDLIAFEKLNLRGLAQSRLARRILDAAWGILLFQIGYKAEEAGRYAIGVDPRGTSQTCSRCGAMVRKRLSERMHECPACGLAPHRDHNSARNILALGRSAVGLAPPEALVESN